MKDEGKSEGEGGLHARCFFKCHRATAAGATAAAPH